MWTPHLNFSALFTHGSRGARKRALSFTTRASSFTTLSGRGLRASSFTTLSWPGHRASSFTTHSGRGQRSSSADQQAGKSSPSLSTCGGSAARLRSFAGTSRELFEILCGSVSDSGCESVVLHGEASRALLELWRHQFTTEQTSLSLKYSY